MEISVIINNYKTRGFLKNCLKEILAHPPTVPYEIIVVDNDSRDGSVEMLREKYGDGTSEKREISERGERLAIERISDRISMIASPKNLGHQAGNNLGIKNSSGKYVLIMNTDIIIFDDIIDRLYRFMEERQDVALVGPKLKYPDGSVQPSCLGFPHLLTPLYRRTFMKFLPAAERELMRYQMTDFGHNETREVDWIFGACEMVRRSAIDKAGLMDEDLFLYFGDVAWSLQFRKHGLPTYYFADAHAVHFHRRESAQGGIMSKAFWIHIKDWFKYLTKYSKYASIYSNKRSS